MNLSRLDWRIILALATSSMLIQQAFSYVCQIVLPFLADRIAEDFGISRAWLGLYLFIQNVASIAAAMGCGAIIIRMGALRISQACLVFMGGSLFVIATGILWLYPIAAILLGAASVSTPASSHILAKYCPPRLAPIIFSIKQTGVPVGSLIAGILIPVLLGMGIYIGSLGISVHLDAYGTCFVIGIIVYMIVLLLQPLREHFDSDRRLDVKFSFSGAIQTMKIVISDASLRDLALCAFALGGLQSIFAGFFILFMIDGLNYSELEAGSAFAIASLTAIGARILWGWLGSTYLSARLVMGGISFFAAVGGVLIGLFDPTWSYNAILIVAILYNVTSLSWHGILLAETARLSPEGSVGGITGGVLAFTSIAMMLYPAFYGGLLAITDSYGIGFTLAALPALFCAFVFFKPPLEGSWIAQGCGLIIWSIKPQRLLFMFLGSTIAAFAAAALLYRNLI
ncbi:MAG: MFS transporter [Alphaproteobacteria bacterium]|nr:MFS transporter [Alphaproteobacteria bacterium]NCF46853.1 MFS transporter [Alphaproteobacteria bacterium]